MARKSKSKGKSSGRMLPVMHPNAAGVDIGAEEIFVAVPAERDADQVRSFGTFTRNLCEVADWLQRCRVQTVAMESTGVYWIPLYQILETRGFQVFLVNAQHVKNVPGRKSDVSDCQWIQYLHSVGLLKASFRPPDEICVIRSLWRHRESLVEMAAEHTQHMQKALSQMNRLCCIKWVCRSLELLIRGALSMFKRRHFPSEIILVCVRWYCKYGISYRDLSEMMQERGVEVDSSTIMRWVHRYAPELEKRVRWHQGYRATSLRVDETYVKVGGKWKYLFRAVDKHGRLIDFMLSDRRNTRAPYRFLGKALTTMRHWPPSSITTDQLGSYTKAISRLQREGKLSNSTKHRTCKYLNNII
jgi:transposase, IS6 family